MQIDEILARLSKVKPNGENSWMACCPAHNDKNPSLSVTLGRDGRTLFRCFAGCPTDKIVAALGLTMADLMGEAENTPQAGKQSRAKETPVKAPAEKPKEKKEAKPFSLATLKPGDIWRLHKREYAFVEWYDYQDENRVILFRKMRFREADGPGKTFIQCTPVDDTLWTFGRASHGVREVIFRLPEVLDAARSGKRIYITEGERDVKTAVRIGLTATCNADGAGKWRPEFADWLKGASEVIIIADKDDGQDPQNPDREYWQGQRHATDIADSLAARGIPHKVILLPDVDGLHVKDLSDWAALEGGNEEVAAGTLPAKLAAIVANAPPWPYDTFRRPLREEPSASILSSPGHPGAAAGRRSSKSKDALTKDAAGGMPHPQSGGDSMFSPPTPHMEPVKNVGGAGKLEDGDPRSSGALKGSLVAILTDRDMTADQRGRACEEAVLEWLRERGQLYFHAELLTHSASMFFDSVTKSLSGLKSDYFHSWLSLSAGISTEARLYGYVHARICAEAMSGENRRGVIPEKYWARRKSSVYISCGNGRMIKITASGCVEVDCGTDGVIFEHGRECLPWKLQDGPGADPMEVCSGFKSAKWKSTRAQTLFKLWLLSMPGHGDRTKPVLLVTGSGGSGKTMLARMVQRLYGIPDRAQMLSRDYKIDSFWAQADAGGMFCLDNADYFVDWLVGCLTTVSTGGTYTKRMNYKDSELVTQRARCWCAVTGVRPYFASESTVSDRLITVEMLRRIGGETKGDDLFDDIDTQRDACLTWICRLWSRALGDTAEPPVAVNTRHPDWGLTAFRLARAADFETDAVSSMTESEAAKAVFAARNDSLGEFLLEAFGATGFTGTMTQMHEALKLRCEGFAEKDWSRERLGKLLNDRLKWIMEGAFGMTRKNHSGSWHYTLKPLQQGDLTPTMWGIDPPRTDTRIADASTHAHAPSPPTPPTSQSLFEGEGNLPEPLFSGESEGNQEYTGPGEDDGWDSL